MPLDLEEHATTEQIDARIRELEAQLLELRRRRNALAHVCRLPTEILVAIFDHLQCKRDKRLPCYTYNRRWYRVMLVCEHFRLVAIQTPALWTVFDYEEDPKEWVDLCLERSKTTPLCVTTNSTALADQWHRIRVAQLRGARTHSLLTAPSPHLTKLSLHVSDENEPLEFGASLLSQISAQLVHLDLNGFGLTLRLGEAVSLPDLQYFELQCIRTGVSLESMIHILADAPKLEVIIIRHLFLKGTEAFDIDEVIAVPGRVALPSLRELAIEDTPIEMWALLRLIPPPRSSLGISVKYMTEAELVLGQALSNIHSLWLGFAQQVPVADDRVQGRILFDRSLNPSTLGIVSFGGITRTDNIFNLRLESDCFLCIRCKPDSSHPILDQVTVAQFRGLSLPIDSNGVYGMDFMPAAHTLIFEDLSEHDKDNMAVFQAWIVARPGRIKNVQFINCDETFKAISEQMREAELALDVTWVSSI
jgi:hypothetical protein